MQNFGGNWTEEKLSVMRNYFQAYATALKNQPFKKYYVDAFAGSGSRLEIQPETDGLDLFGDDFDDFSEVKNGSVCVALGIEPKFDRYIFADRSERNVAQLETLQAQFPDRAIEIQRCDANDFLVNLAETTN